MTLTIDGTEPGIKIEFAGDDPDNKIANVSPNIPVTISDNGGIASLELRLVEQGPTDVSIRGGNQRSFNGEKQVTVEVSPTRSLIDGLVYALEVVAKDIAGNDSTSRLLFSIDLTMGDKTSPTFTFVFPPAKGLTDGNPAISILLVDNESGLDFGSFEVNLEGPAGPIEDLGEFIVSASSLKQAAVKSKLSGLKPGEYNFTGTVKDKNGNIGAGKQTFTVLGKPPVITLDPKAPEFIDSSPLTISGTVDVASIQGGATVEISRDGNLITTANVDGNTGGVTSGVPRGISLTREPLPPSPSALQFTMKAASQRRALSWTARRCPSGWIPTRYRPETPPGHLSLAGQSSATTSCQTAGICCPSTPKTPLIQRKNRAPLT